MSGESNKLGIDFGFPYHTIPYQSMRERKLHKSIFFLFCWMTISSSAFIDNADSCLASKRMEGTNKQQGNECKVVLRERIRKGKICRGEDLCARCELDVLSIIIFSRWLSLSFFLSSWESDQPSYTSSFSSFWFEAHMHSLENHQSNHYYYMFPSIRVERYYHNIEIKGEGE